MPFLDPLDVANRACDHLGATHIASPTEESVNNSKIAPIYDKVRRAELRRNIWRFAIRDVVLRPIDTTTYTLSPAQWANGIYYPPGSIVADSNNQLWLSTALNNIGNQPGLSDVWESYFGSLTADVFDPTVTYSAGELVYMAGANSSYVIYLSLTNGNSEVPNTPDTWDATVTYQQEQTVLYSGMMWRSLIAINLNNIPAGAAANWLATQTYTSGQWVTGSDGYQYTSVGNNNIGNNPVSDSGANWTNTSIPNAWAAVPVLPQTASTWVPIYASLKTLNIVYPLNAGPLKQALTKNMFRLPAGYLRQFVDDPKQGINPFLGAPSGRVQNDWVFKGDYIISQQGTPILLTFIADIQTVSKMDDMFCEGLAAKIGWEACEAITGSSAKKADCLMAYNKIMGEARITSAIEVGTIEPPEDDYITCRT